MKKITPMLLILLLVLFSTNVLSQTILDIPVISGTNGNDVEERISDGIMDITSSDLELCADDDGDQLVGIRFQNVNVPQGAIISSAYIQFQVDETTDSGAVTIDIVGIDVDDAAVFTATASNISDRIDGDISSATTAFQSWSPPEWTSAGAQGVDQQTSDLSAIVKELVDRGGWVSGNAMAFVFSPNSGSPARRFAEESSNGVLTLHIEYVTGPADIDVSGNNVSIADGDTTPDVADDTQFGNVSVGQTLDRTFTIKNQGAANLTLISGTIVPDAEFTVTTLPPVPTVLGGQSTTFVVSFTPTSATTFSSTITINSSDADESPYTFVVEGAGVIPDVEIDILDTYSNAIDDGSGNSPSIINSTDFGGTDAASPITTTFRIENNGTTDLAITTPTSSNADFSIVSNPAALISGGSFSTFDVTFTPSSTGLISSTITIANDDTDENPLIITPLETVDYYLIGENVHKCTDSIDFTLDVYATPMVDLGDSIYLYSCEPVQLDAGGGDGSEYYIWNNGNRTRSITVYETGNYSVIVGNPGCEVSDTGFVSLCNGKLFMPNAFTPNEDGINETLKPITSDPTIEFHMMIFDRWGKLLFETHDIHQGWDGTSDGEPCPTGNYVYRLDFQGQGTNSPGKKASEVGTVMLVR